MPLKTFLVNKIKGQKFRLNGIMPSNRLPNKRNLCKVFRNHVLYAPEQLPPKVDLRPEMTPVEDQSQIGSCTANSIAGAYEYLTKKAHGSNTDVSRLFIYYNGRVKGQSSQSVTDSGCSMTDTIEGLEECGTCLESLWQYDISRVNTRPDDNAYQQAAPHKISEALQVSIDLNEMKTCLAQGFPFAFGLRLYTSFDKAAQTGVVPMPDSGDSGRQSDGNHALLAVGYSDQSNAFIVRNSWGESWGDKGYCYIPYDYITNSDYCFDAWTIKKVANDDFGQQNWHSHDSVDYTNVDNNDSPDDDYDGDNHAIEEFDEDDDDGNGNGGYNSNQGAWGNDRNRRGNDYSRDDGDYDDNRNRYDQDNQQFDDSDRQFRGGRSNFGNFGGGFSNFN